MKGQQGIGRPSWRSVVSVFLCLGLAIASLSLGNITPALADGVTEAELSEMTELWKGSAHALSEINCSSCHQDSETEAFVQKPNYESCQSCHEFETDTFLLGKHGIRLNEGQSPLTPAKARLAMKPEAHSKQMNCNACHNVHSVNTYEASVDSCLTCHNDQHSLNYETSKHAELFVAEGVLPRPSSASVTCATCHLPRETHQETSGGDVLVNHNNTYTLKPRDRMVSEVCMNCHGMEYAYNSIFDNELVESNFAQPPKLHLKSFDMVRVLRDKREGK